MDIRAARLTPHPGSAIAIEETLEPGRNYFRYYAYYYSEGLKIYALLTVPYAEMPATGYPAIVFNHGYIPPDVYRTTERYIAYVDNLAQHGYIVFRIDYRGHDRSEGEARGAYSDPATWPMCSTPSPPCSSTRWWIRSALACGVTPWAATSPCAP